MRCIDEIREQYQDGIIDFITAVIALENEVGLDQHHAEDLVGCWWEPETETSRSMH